MVKHLRGPQLASSSHTKMTKDDSESVEKCSWPFWCNGSNRAYGILYDSWSWVIQAQHRVVQSWLILTVGNSVQIHFRDTSEKKGLSEYGNTEEEKLECGGQLNFPINTDITLWKLNLQQINEYQIFTKNSLKGTQRLLH